MALRILKLFLRFTKYLLRKSLPIILIGSLGLPIFYHIYFNITEHFREKGATSISVKIGERKLLSYADRWYTVDEVEITGEGYYFITVVSAICGKRLGFDKGEYIFALSTLILPSIRGCSIADFNAKPKPTCHIVWLASSESTKIHEIKHCLGYAHTGRN